MERDCNTSRLEGIVQYPVALFPRLEKLPGAIVTTTSAEKLHYTIQVEGVENKEFEGTLKMWADHHLSSLKLPRSEDRLISDDYLFHRAYTLTDYAMATDAIRLSDSVLTEFKKS